MTQLNTNSNQRTFGYRDNFGGIHNSCTSAVKGNQNLVNLDRCKQQIKRKRN